MNISLVNFINRKILGGHERSVKAKKNIIASFFIKGSSMVVGFLMVRITLDYLDKTKYGIWLTLSSFLTWFTFFELGLGSGLRNKLAEALAIKDYKLGRIYVSTTYAILSITVSILAILFFVINNFINWAVILNTDPALEHELSLLAVIVFGFFFLRFVVKLIGVILYADQRPALANSFGPLGNLLSLIIIFLLQKTTKGSLIYLGLTLSIMPVLILVIASIFLYSNEYKKIAPSLLYVKFSYGKDLLGLGVKFFIIQLSALVMFQSTNIIIAQFFGPVEVTIYNIAYKYYGIINVLFSIIMIPYWSAFTEAWVKKELQWIKKTINGLLFVFLLIVVLSIIMYLVSPLFYKFWLGRHKMDKIHIDNILQISLIIYFLFLSFGGVFNMFINGVGKVTLQMYCLLIGAMLFFPITYVLVKIFHLGMEGVVISTIISNFYSPIIAPIQYSKLTKGKADGLWYK